MTSVISDTSMIDWFCHWPDTHTQHKEQGEYTLLQMKGLGSRVELCSDRRFGTSLFGLVHSLGKQLNSGMYGQCL